MNDDDLAPLLGDYFRSGAATQDREAMMFFRVGTEILNLSSVTNIYEWTADSRKCIHINFIGGTWTRVYKDTDEAHYSELVAWMKALPLLDRSKTIL